ncbi:low-density lipoprotein receptor-related protein 4-like isoform X1 [Ostrea edulis]|uniref:low-density lipoprotein receptor-related protein 4-like isoform X1 n=1 Tax=Ostrea edulis TaxID=37623 RepID=UPI0024AE911A|nr:low-density lipoprotein receptor-related protein 4-like isoform X1 [Ostrea edulis]
MMLILTLLGLLMLNGYSGYGIPGNKGLILGIWNPASLATITEIPKSRGRHFNNVSTTLKSGNLITSIASDPQKKVVFLSIKDSIYNMKNFSIWQNTSTSVSVEHKGKSNAIGQIAFDYVSKNLYWCDSLLKWIAMKPAYTNDTIHNVVVDENLKQPEGLTLDPEDGLMFFSDNAANSRIEKASMNGKNRSVIVHTGLIRVLALSVDTGTNVLYWADYARHTLEACNYDGLRRRVLKRLNQVSVTGLQYYQNMLHAVSTGAKTVFGIDTTSGSSLYSLKLESAKPFAVHVYDEETPKYYLDPCSSRGCQHMCVNTPTGPTCLCAEGSRLSTDSLTCTESSWINEDGFVVNNATTFFLFSVLSVNGRRGQIPYLSVSSSFIETFAVDANLHVIYYIDSKNRALKELNIVNKQIRKLASVSSARDLIFDWISNLLGWIEPHQSSIRTFSLNSRTISTIYSGLQRPVSLTLDAHNGYLFWISGSSGKSIMRGTWNRDTPKIIVSSANMGNPSSLHYDVTSSRIYWLDGTIIKSCMVNGSDIKSHIIAVGATQAFAYKDFFGWIFGNKLHFARKSASTKEVDVDAVENAKEVTVYDSSLQQDRRGSCYVLNGGCEDICISTQSGRKCECDLGLQLQSDLKTCDSSVFSTNFILVADYSHGRIVQIDISTGNLVKLPISIRTVPGIAFDKTTMEIFYSDTTTKTIMSTSLHGQNTTLFYTTGFAYADRLAIDYSTGIIYYTAVGPTPSQSYIGVVHRKISLHKTLLSNLHRPREIVLYPSKGFLYWTEFGNITEIGRAYMDGTSKIYIATTDLGWPNGLAIDYTSERLYWTDGLKNRIEYSDLNGGNRRVLTTDNEAHLMNIVIHEHYLYYTAWNRQRITKMDKETGSKVTFMSNHPELGRLDSLAIYADDMNDVSTTCLRKNGNCSTFCFPTPFGRTCGCQDNVDLQSDQTTCQGVSRCITPQNVELPDCVPYPGQTCEFKCKPGYRFANSKYVTCDAFGRWVPSVSSLCIEITCPLEISNGNLSASCGGRVGEQYGVLCAKNFVSVSLQLVCTNSGSWNRETRNICVQTARMC